MNNFLFDELLANEYRREQLIRATEHNRSPSATEAKLSLLVYRALSKIGEFIETQGAKMQERYQYLALREECKLLLSH